MVPTGRHMAVFADPCSCAGGAVEGATDPSGSPR